MSTASRFAPPSASLQDGDDSAGDLWRDGEVRVLRRGAASR